MFDGEAFGKEVVELVQGFVEREVAPLKSENEQLKQRIAALEARPTPEKGDAGEKGMDGVSPAPEAIAEAFAPLASEIIVREIGKAVAELPPPEKGEPGEPGQSVTLDDVQPLISETVRAAVEALPKPKDGEPGKDAPGFSDVLKDNGELVIVLQDGTVRRTGIKDGQSGKDGRDGFGFDDLDVCVLDDDRTIEISFRHGDDEKAFTLKWPTVIDRGVFKAERETPYEPGDGVTWGGQFYICNEQTNEKPDQSKDGKPWRLAVRKGRDGKDRTKE